MLAPSAMLGVFLSKNCLLLFFNYDILFFTDCKTIDNINNLPFIINNMNDYNNQINKLYNDKYSQILFINNNIIFTDISFNIIINVSEFYYDDNIIQINKEHISHLKGTNYNLKLFIDKLKEIYTSVSDKITIDINNINIDERTNNIINYTLRYKNIILQFIQSFTPPSKKGRGEDVSSIGTGESDIRDFEEEELEEEFEEEFEVIFFFFFKLVSAI